MVVADIKFCRLSKIGKTAELKNYVLFGFSLLGVILLGFGLINYSYFTDSND